MKSRLLFLSFFVSIIAFGSPQDVGFSVSEDLIPTTNFSDGAYHSPVGSHLFRVKITSWGPEKILSGYLSYGGYLSPFEVTLTPSDETGYENFFVGRGRMKQSWSTGNVCTYRVGMQLYAYTNENQDQFLFIRSFMPSSVYTTWDIASYGCPPAAGPYVWETDKRPYFRGAQPTR